jgi:putative lipoprotein
LCPSEARGLEQTGERAWGMRSRTILAAATGAATWLAWASAAGASEPDPWWGTDKALHFGACAVISAGAYTIGADLMDARYKALLLGAGAGIAAGAGKELADMAGLGDPSWRDFTWDVVGTVVGLGAAWGLDLAIRGSGREHPTLGSARSALQPGLVFRF